MVGTKKKKGIRENFIAKKEIKEKDYMKKGSNRDKRMDVTSRDISTKRTKRVQLTKETPLREELPKGKGTLSGRTSCFIGGSTSNESKRARSTMMTENMSDDSDTEELEEIEKGKDEAINTTEKEVRGDDIRHETIDSVNKWMNDIACAVDMGIEKGSFDKLVASHAEETELNDGETISPDENGNSESKTSDRTVEKRVEKDDCKESSAMNKEIMQREMRGTADSLKTISDRKDIGPKLNEEQSGFVRGAVHKYFFRGYKFLPQGGSLMNDYSHLVQHILERSNIARSCVNPTGYIKDIEKKLRWYTAQKRNTVVQQIQVAVKSK
jgi:hypothetical protein